MIMTDDHEMRVAMAAAEKESRTPAAVAMAPSLAPVEQQPADGGWALVQLFTSL